MTNKTIKERGLTTVTLPAPDPFSFDKETRKLELLAYYKYCADHMLLTTTGEQSRLSLIRKTYNNLGGTGDTAYDAMRSWLQIKTGASDPDIQDLWVLYFAQHATVPDDEGVTYLGLSLESAYRKFLLEFLGLGAIYNDFIYPIDDLRAKLTKVFGDNVNATDSVLYGLGLMRSFSDNVTMNSTVVITQNKTIADIVNAIDSSYTSFTKVINDNVTLMDTFEIVGGSFQLYNDQFLLSDSHKLFQSKVFGGDSITPSDIITMLQNAGVTDSITFSDSITTVLQGLGDVFSDVFIGDQVLILQIKSFNDNVTINDSALSGYIGFGAGVFNRYLFNA